MSIGSQKLPPTEASRSKEAGEGPFPNRIRYYKHIALVLFAAFGVAILALLFFHVKPVQAALSQVLGPTALLLLELYFWSALGGTVASYKYFSEDKEKNELESLRKRPDPRELRYPNVLDVILYIQRILFSGVLGVIGAMIVVAGLGYFEVQLTTISDKQRMFFVVFAFIVGIYQNDFLGFLKELNKRWLLKKEPPKSGESGEA